MIGLDTNVLDRFVVADDPIQGPIVKRMVENRCTQESPGVVNKIVLCELVWVLRESYGYSTGKIHEVLETILRSDRLMVEDQDVAWRSLERARNSGAEFTDCLIGRTNKALGCETTFTFDKRASRSPDMTRLVESMTDTETP